MRMRTRMWLRGMLACAHVRRFSYARQTYNAPGFADTYGDYAKSSPYRMFAERWIQSRLLGDLHGKRVLDLACGDGIGTRWLSSLGASEVVGVDVSEEVHASALSVSGTRDILPAQLMSLNRSLVGSDGENCTGAHASQHEGEIRGR